MTFGTNTIFKISENIVYRKRDDGNFILLEIEGNRLFELNDVSASIWSHIVDGHSVKDIYEAIKEEFEVSESDMDDVRSFIDELIEAKVISA